VPLDLQDRKVRKDQLVPLVNQVPAEHQDLLAWEVQTVHQAFLDHKALQDRKVRRVLPAIQDLLDLSDPVGLQVVRVQVGLQV